KLLRLALLLALCEASEIPMSEWPDSVSFAAAAAEILNDTCEILRSRKQLWVKCE
nr:hypothetical protein [Tanacetum cinerariifolium]